MKRNLAFAAAGLTLLAVSLNAQSVKIAEIAPRPLTATPAATETPVNTLVLYDNSGCRKQVGVVDISMIPSNQFHEMPQGAKDNISSLRWNLEPGVVVVFYNNGMEKAVKGGEVAIFGNGQNLDLRNADLNDKISSWSWYRVY